MLDLVDAGFIKKSFGAEGAVKLALDPLFQTDFPNCKFIFIELDGSKVPFFIVDRKKDNEIISLEDVDTPEEANKLSNKKIYLERSNLSSSNIHKEITDERLLIGYSLFDVNANKDVGKIKSVEKFPQQIMLIVEKLGEELMIPLAIDWIVNIDPDSKRVSLDLPEGIY